MDVLGVKMNDNLIKYAVISGLADMHGQPYDTISRMPEADIAGMVSDQFRQFLAMKKAWLEMRKVADVINRIEPVMGD